MKKVILFFLFFSLNLFGINAFAKSVLKIAHWKTTNGANVYFVRAPELPMLDIQVTFIAGSIYDGKLYGLAALTSGMIGEGTPTLSADQIAASFDDIGAQFNAGIDRDKATISLRTLTNPKYLSKAISLFQDVINHPTFPLKELQYAKNQTLASIKIENQDPAAVAKNAFYQQMYGDFGYSHLPEGTLITVPAITEQEIVNFYHQYYVAKNAYIVLVGDISNQQAHKIANQIIGKLPSGKPAKKFALAPRTSASVVKHIHFPSKQTTIIVGQVGITRQDPNYFPLMVGNHIFGGPGLTSILYKHVREERGFAYAVMSQFLLWRYRGPYLLFLQTKSSQTEEALKIVKNVLQQYLKTGPTSAQLQAAKLNIIGSFPIALDSNSKIESAVSNIAFYHLPIDYFDHYQQYINSVSASEIKNAFQKEIHPKQLIIITVGPNEKNKE